jgi:hypothetical protein
MRRKDEEAFIKDMANIYGLGHFLLSRKNISHKIKARLQKRVEHLIDKRISYYARKLKNQNGEWVHVPANFDERNKKPIYSLYKKYARFK